MGVDWRRPSHAADRRKKATSRGYSDGSEMSNVLSLVRTLTNAIQLRAHGRTEVGSHHVPIRISRPFAAVLLVLTLN